MSNGTRAGTDADSVRNTITEVELDEKTTQLPPTDSAGKPDLPPVATYAMADSTRTPFDGPVILPASRRPEPGTAKDAQESE